MANHAPTNSKQTYATPAMAADMTDHKATYTAFLDWSVAGTIECLFIMVALVSFRFMDGWLALVTGFGGIVVGLVVSLLGLRLGGKWAIPVAALVLYGLFVAANVHGA